jgi:hypothetical protein
MSDGEWAREDEGSAKGSPEITSVTIWVVDPPPQTYIY